MVGHLVGYRPCVLRALVVALAALALAGPASAFSKEDGMQTMDDGVPIAFTRYTPDGGIVDVVVSSADGRAARVEVANTGPGIPAADLPHVFERFYRVDQSRGRAGGGSAASDGRADRRCRAGRAEPQADPRGPPDRRPAPGDCPVRSRTG